MFRYSHRRARGGRTDGGEASEPDRLRGFLNADSHSSIFTAPCVCCSPPSSLTARIYVTESPEPRGESPSDPCAGFGSSSSWCQALGGVPGGPVGWPASWRPPACCPCCSTCRRLVRRITLRAGSAKAKGRTAQVRTAACSASDEGARAMHPVFKHSLSCWRNNVREAA